MKSYEREMRGQRMGIVDGGLPGLVCLSLPADDSSSSKQTLEDGDVLSM